MSDITARKAELRSLGRELRCALESDACIRAAEDAAALTLALPELADARVVLAYGATPEEIDPAPLVAALRSRGATIVLPRIEEPGVLGLHVVGSADDLVTGAFGLLEPAADAPRAADADIDVVLVPGVAFDAQGHRLGYGGGYYDRLLPRLPVACSLIGLAYDEQIFAKVPAEDHDARVDLVVTPTRVLRRDARD